MGAGASLPEKWHPRQKMMQMTNANKVMAYRGQRGLFGSEA
jgi:hypothetical protein